MAQLIRDLLIFKALLDHFPHSFYVKEYTHDGNGTFVGGQFVRVSQTKADHYGLSIRQILGKTDFDLLPLDQARKAQADDLWVMHNKQPIKNRRERITHPSGDVVWVSVTKMPLMYDGAVSGIIGISIDITEQVRAEQRAREIKVLVQHLLIPLASIAQVLHPKHKNLSAMLQKMLLALKKACGEK